MDSHHYRFNDDNHLPVVVDKNGKRRSRTPRFIQTHGHVNAEKSTEKPVLITDHFESDYDEPKNLEKNIEKIKKYTSAKSFLKQNNERMYLSRTLGTFGTIDKINTYIGNMEDEIGIQLSEKNLEFEFDVNERFLFISKYPRKIIFYDCFSQQLYTIKTKYEIKNAFFIKVKYLVLLFDATTLQSTIVRIENESEMEDVGANNLSGIGIPKELIPKTSQKKKIVFKFRAWDITMNDLALVCEMNNPKPLLFLEAIEYLSNNAQFVLPYDINPLKEKRITKYQLPALDLEKLPTFSGKLEGVCAEFRTNKVFSIFNLLKKSTDVCYLNLDNEIEYCINLRDQSGGETVLNFKNISDLVTFMDEMFFDIVREMVSFVY